MLFQLFDQQLLLPVAEQCFAFELLGDAPAFFAVKTEEQRWSFSRVIIAVGHHLKLFVEQLIRHPVVAQRHLAILASDQIQPTTVRPVEPDHEVGGVADRRGKQHQPNVLREETQRQFPDDASFRIVEAVELVHHDRCDF